MKKINDKYQLKDLSLDELKNLMEEMSEKKFRGQQIFNWMYNHLSTDFDEMENLSKDLRAKLDETCSLKTLDVLETDSSPNTKTKKYLFKTYDNKEIEAVVIPDKKRNTLCLSTQVGCPLDCKFCATGLLGYKRNLTPGEIIDQYLLTAKEFGKESITNIVYMGMGEPLLNFDATLKSLQILTSEFNKSISRTRITVSTSGIPHKIMELSESGLRVKLALSLHSPFEDVRSKIMPINDKYSLDENLEALKHYTKKTKTRMTFEYTMLKGINDRDEDIKALTKICHSLPSKINIIPFNSISHIAKTGLSAQLEPTSHERIEEFADKLRSKNVTVMIRNTQGDDIAAACGQLAAKKKEQNA